MTIVEDGVDHFSCNVEIAVSPQFFAWIFGFGNEAEILGPASVKNQFLTQIKSVQGMYCN